MSNYSKSPRHAETKHDSFFSLTLGRKKKKEGQLYFHITAEF